MVIKSMTASGTASRTAPRMASETASVATSMMELTPKSMTVTKSMTPWETVSETLTALLSVSGLASETASVATSMVELLRVLMNTSCSHEFMNSWFSCPWIRTATLNATSINKPRGLCARALNKRYNFPKSETRRTAYLVVLIDPTAVARMAACHRGGRVPFVKQVPDSRRNDFEVHVFDKASFPAVRCVIVTATYQRL